jgi:hypothetical protein
MYLSLYLIMNIAEVLMLKATAVAYLIASVQRGVMRFYYSRGAMSLLCISVSGCAGDPAVYMDHKPSAPRIMDTARQISCEIYKADGIGTLADNGYFATVLPAIQVEDNVDGTPSLSYIHPFTTAMTNFTGTVGGDYGGA